MTFKIRSIPQDHHRGWKVMIDGEEKFVGKIELTSRFGTLEYGFRLEGYDGWVFREQGGGGAVTVPYTRTPEGELFVGLILEKRANMGDQPVWCAIGGFVYPDETHAQAQARESNEEAGLDTATAEELVGMATNANRAFFVADVNEGEGVRAYGLRLPFEWLEADGESFKLKDVVLLPSFKRGSDVRLFRWRHAVRMTADGLARSAIAQLLVQVL